MVVRESYSQLPHCPVPTQWRPSVATQHSTQIFSEESEKSVANTAFRNSERKPACLSHPWAFNTQSEQGCSYSGAATTENSKANLVCGWSERGMGKPSPSVGLCRGLSLAGINPCPVHRALCHSLPGLLWHTPGPNQALAYPPRCRCLQVVLLNTSKRCLSQKHVYIFSIFWAFKHFIRSEIPTTASGDPQKIQSLAGKRGI